MLLTFLSRTPLSLACILKSHLESTVCSYHRLTEKPHCFKHGGLKILLPSLNVKDTHNSECQRSISPWGEASFSGVQLGNVFRKVLSMHMQS